MKRDRTRELLELVVNTAVQMRQAAKRLQEAADAAQQQAHDLEAQARGDGNGDE